MAESVVPTRRRRIGGRFDFDEGFCNGFSVGATRAFFFEWLLCSLLALDPRFLLALLPFSASLRLACFFAFSDDLESLVVAVIEEAPCSLFFREDSLCFATEPPSLSATLRLELGARKLDGVRDLLSGFDPFLWLLVVVSSSFCVGFDVVLLDETKFREECFDLDLRLATDVATEDASPLALEAFFLEVLEETDFFDPSSDWEWATRRRLFSDCPRPDCTFFKRASLSSS